MNKKRTLVRDIVRPVWKKTTASTDLDASIIPPLDLPRKNQVSQKGHGSNYLRDLGFFSVLFETPEGDPPRLERYFEKYRFMKNR